jgi:hypothetical protein
MRNTEVAKVAEPFFSETMYLKRYFITDLNRLYAVS